MKKLILFVIIILPLNLFSQVIEEMPTNDNGQIYFSEVIELEGFSQNDLYLNAKEFFVNTFKSADDVIQMDDKEDALIIGKPLSVITITVMGMGTEVKLYYTIKIQSKDGRYKYEIYDLFFKTYPNPQVPETTTSAEEMFAEETYYKRNGKPKGALEQYKDKTLSEIGLIINSIKNNMNTTDASSSSDW